MKLQSALKRIESRYGPDSPNANPLKFGITGLDKVSKETPIVLYCRVSTRVQESRRNLDDQVRHNKKQLLELGYRVISTHSEAASGWEYNADERPSLAKAVNIAKKAGAVIVVEDYDRLVRSVGYDPTRNNRVLPTEHELTTFLEMLHGVPVACITAPNKDRFGKGGQRSAETKRGQEQKGRKGGRPRKRRTGCKLEIRRIKKPQAIYLRSDGKSIRRISYELNVPKSTIHNWLRDT